MEFEALVEKMKPRMAMLLNQLKIYKNRDDFMQIALIALWEASTTYIPGKYDFFAYVYNKMRYKVIDALRKEAKYEQTNTPMAEDLLEVVDKSSKHEVMFVDIVQEMFKDLTNEEKQLLKMMFVVESSTMEIAQYFEISIEAARKRKYRLMQKLKNAKERV